MEGKEKGDMKKVLVVGSLNMDMVLSVDHHPVPGETIIGDGITYHPGGKGNQKRKDRLSKEVKDITVVR